MPASPTGGPARPPAREFPSFNEEGESGATTHGDNSLAYLRGSGLDLALRLDEMHTCAGPESFEGYLAEILDNESVAIIAWLTPR
jgi:hypothetical protein